MGDGAFSLGVKLPGRKTDHSHLSSAEVKECVKLYLHSPNTPQLLGAQLKRSTDTTLPFQLPWLFIYVLSMHSENERVFLTPYHSTDFDEMRHEMYTLKVPG
jgi:hypothetical protein